MLRHWDHKQSPRFISCLTGRRNPIGVYSSSLMKLTLSCASKWQSNLQTLFLFEPTWRHLNFQYLNYFRRSWNSNVKYDWECNFMIGGIIQIYHQCFLCFYWLIKIAQSPAYINELLLAFASMVISWLSFVEKMLGAVDSIVAQFTLVNRTMPIIPFTSIAIR